MPCREYTTPVLSVYRSITWAYETKKNRTKVRFFYQLKPALASMLVVMALHTVMTPIMAYMAQMATLVMQCGPIMG